MIISGGEYKAMIISDGEKCTGCGMCVDLCVQNAISMNKDRHGFYYPSIDLKKCVSCGACQRRCPANNAESVKADIPIEVNAAWNKNKDKRKIATSGGVFSVLAECIIEDGGVVAGVRWNDEFQAEHYMAETMDELSGFNGSKYVQSHTNSIYSKVKKALCENKKVLFSGTPCQNHALKLFLGKEYTNLYMVDLICHGVPSDDVFQRYLAERSADGKVIKRISFRDKKPFWDWSYVTIDFENSPQYAVLTNEDSYFALFNIGYSLRESCHRCKYTNMNRYGDITLADFWGYKAKNFKTRDYLKGTSLVILNSEKGKAFFQKIKHKLVCVESTKEEAIHGQQALKKPVPPPTTNVLSFWNDYDEGMSIDGLRNKYVGIPYCPPKYLWLRRLYHRYKWVIKRNGTIKK